MEPLPKSITPNFFLYVSLQSSLSLAAAALSVCLSVCLSLSLFVLHICLKHGLYSNWPVPVCPLFCRADLFLPIVALYLSLNVPSTQLTDEERVYLNAAALGDVPII